MAGMELSPPPNGLGLMDQAQSQYPILKGLGLNYKYSPGAQPYMLESWPANETGSSSYPRPKEFPMNSFGVEVYDPKTRPIDILGDVVSHHLINTHPVVQQYYNDFKQSLTGDQKARLQSQYQWAQKNEGEKRPYKEWAESSGIPAYFRGYPFQQWENASSMYTPDQMDALDEMMKGLRGEIPFQVKKSKKQK